MSKIIADTVSKVLRFTQKIAWNMLVDGTIQKAHDDDVMAVMQMPCGSGKTWILLLWAILFCEKGKKIVIITFRLDPIRQIMDDYNNMRSVLAKQYMLEHDVRKSIAISKLEGVMGGIDEVRSGQTRKNMINVFLKNRIVVVNAQMMNKLPKECLKMICGFGIDEVQFVSTDQMTQALHRTRIQRERTSRRNLLLFGVSATPNSRSDRVSIGGFNPEEDRNTLAQMPRFFEVGSELQSIAKGEIRPMVLNILTQKQDVTQEIDLEQKMLMLITLAVTKVIEISNYHGHVKEHRIILLKVSGKDEANETTTLINRQRFSRQNGKSNAPEGEDVLCAVALHHEVSPQNRDHILHQLEKGRDYDIIVVYLMLNDSYSNSRVSIVCIPYKMNERSHAIQLSARAGRVTGGKMDDDRKNDAEYMQRETAYIFSMEENTVLQDHFDDIPYDMNQIKRKLSFPRTMLKKVDIERNLQEEEDEEEEEEEEEEDEFAAANDPSFKEQLSDSGNMSSSSSEKDGDITFKRRNNASGDSSSEDSDGDDSLDLNEKQQPEDEQLEDDEVALSTLSEDTRNSMLLRCKQRGCVHMPNMNLGIDVIYVDPLTRIRKIKLRKAVQKPVVRCFSSTVNIQTDQCTMNIRPSSY